MINLSPRLIQRVNDSIEMEKRELRVFSLETAIAVLEIADAVLPKQDALFFERKIRAIADNLTGRIQNHFCHSILTTPKKIREEGCLMSILPYFDLTYRLSYSGSLFTALAHGRNGQLERFKTAFFKSYHISHSLELAIFEVKLENLTLQLKQMKEFNTDSNELKALSADLDQIREIYQRWLDQP